MVVSQHIWMQIKVKWRSDFLSFSPLRYLFLSQFKLQAHSPGLCRQHLDPVSGAGADPSAVGDGCSGWLQAGGAKRPIPAGGVNAASVSARHCNGLHRQTDLKPVSTATVLKARAGEQRWLPVAPPPLFIIASQTVAREHALGTVQRRERPHLRPKMPCVIRWNCVILRVAFNQQSGDILSQCLLESKYLVVRFQKLQERLVRGLYLHGWGEESSLLFWGGVCFSTAN